MTSAQEYITNRIDNFQALRKQCMRLYIYPGFAVFALGIAIGLMPFAAPARWICFSIALGGGVWLQIGLQNIGALPAESAWPLMTTPSSKIRRSARTAVQGSSILGRRLVLTVRNDSSLPAMAGLHRCHPIYIEARWAS